MLRQNFSHGKTDAYIKNKQARPQSYIKNAVYINYLKDLL